MTAIGSFLATLVANARVFLFERRWRHGDLSTSRRSGGDVAVTGQATIWRADRPLGPDDTIVDEEEEASAPVEASDAFPGDVPAASLPGDPTTDAPPPKR